MTRRRVTKIARGPRNCRNIVSYFSQPAMKTPAVIPSGPPPAKKTKLDLSLLLPPPSTAVITPPPSLLSPSSSPPLSSSTTTKPIPTNLKTTVISKTTMCTVISKKPSPLLSSDSIIPPTPPTSVPLLSTSDDLEQLLMLRGINFDRRDISSDQVKVFSRTQTSICDSLINHIQYMGMRKDRLCRLMDYLLVQLSHSRMPSGNIMTSLWNMTTDIEVVSRCLDGDAVQSVACFYHSILSLHPPGFSRTAHQQYCLFIQSLGEERETGGLFTAWSHIKELLSPPHFKYFHHHITFLVDLLLSEFWSHLNGSRTGQPLFVSVFWSRPNTTDTLSLPVRQLLDIIQNMLEHYSGTEIELFVLQSLFALLYLIMTRCKDAVMVELTQLANKLNKDQCVLLLSLLHPQSVHITLIKDFLQFLPVTTTFKTQLQLSPNSKLASFNQLSIATNHPSLPLQSSTTTAPYPAILHKTQDNVKPLNCVKTTTKRHISWCTKPPSTTETKRVKVSGRRTCENCDYGVGTCLRCNSSK